MRQRDSTDAEYLGLFWPHLPQEIGDYRRDEVSRFAVQSAWAGAPGQAVERFGVAPSDFVERYPLAADARRQHCPTSTPPGEPSITCSALKFAKQIRPTSIIHSWWPSWK
jgi:hypothetical protein